MKEIIKVDLKTRKIEADKCKTDLLCVGVFSDAKKLDSTTNKLDKQLDGAISRLIDLGDFKGKAGQIAMLYTNKEIAASRIILAGLGEKRKVTLDSVRDAAANIANKAVELKAGQLSITLHNALGGKFDMVTVGQVIAEGLYIGSYRYDEYITKDDDGRLDCLKAELIDTDSAKLRKLTKGLSSGVIIGNAQSYARTIANRPGNVITPQSLAEEAKKITKGIKELSCTVFDEKQLREKRMGGILAVGSGSKNKPRLIILKYTPKNPAAEKPVAALVGKAVTFDSGGISIKPTAHMDQMKFDKSGGIAVLATMKAVAALGLKINVYGIIPAVENMPGGSSYRPGDIVSTFSGKTVEVLDTDAEGRMILCDAIHYAVKQNCDVIVDIATLTGACMVALGKYMAGLMGNDNNLIKQLEKASKDSGEKLWHMPSGTEYLEEVKSKIADLKNIGSRWGGACTAAAFLGEFVGEKKWAHIDMAGVDMFEGPNKAVGVGARGFGVRLLTGFLQNIDKK